ncbi:MAG: DUF1648 domain-containing protein [Chlorobi bacterium]|nr:DUF1648 domain-containing protein [Chlorobiota bacterium]
MKKINLNLALLIIISIIAILQPILFYNQLPEKVASHFTASGEANSFMDKNSFVMFAIGVILFLDVLFIGLSKLMNIISDSGFNLPHKDYWLHPARRETTIKTLKKMLYTTSAITLIFLTAIMRKIIECNIDGTFHLDSAAFTYLIIYVVGLSFYIITLFLKFSRIPKEN